MRLVFMGTPDFAVPSLKKVLDEGYEVAGVFTQPDKPKGRGYTMTPPPVKELALSYDLPVYQPDSLRTPQAVQLLRELAPEVIVVVAYGKILPKEILDLPPVGCINVHGSLLPKYRGAAPIQWAVLNGDAVSGVTTMLMADGIDTGDILDMEETPIGLDETAGELFDRLAEMGAGLLIKTLRRAQEGPLCGIPQKESEATHAPRLTHEMSKLDWKKPAMDLHNQVRGLSPWPCAVTWFGKKRLKVLAARPVAGFGGKPGEAQNRDGAFVVACGKGALELCRVQAEGGKPMSGAEFLRGHPLQPGVCLEGKDNQ